MFRRIPSPVARLHRALKALHMDVEIAGFDATSTVWLRFRELPTTVRKKDRAAREKLRADAVAAAAAWCGVTIHATEHAPRRPRERSARADEARGRRPPPTEPPRPTTADDLAALGLDAMPDKAALRRAWRDAAKRHHPDAGGDAEAFKRARAAYERLARQVGA